MYTFYTFVIINFISFCNAVPTPSTSSLPACKIKDANANECLKAYLQETVKYSKQGNPKLSIPSFDPYFIPRIVLPASKNDGVNVEVTNSTVLGFSKAKIIKVQSDPAKGVFDIHYITPVTTFLGQYILTGKLFNSQINGKGRSEVSLIELYHALKVKGEVKDNLNGNKYLHVNSVTIHLKPQKMKLRFDDLFKDNKQLSDIVNQMMNDNWRDLFAKLQPRIEEEMSKHLFKIISDFFREVPYNEIFPDV